MNRRAALAAGGGAALSGLAGCLDALGFGTRSARAPPLPDYRPPAVYLPTHVEGMRMVGRASTGGYECALTYTFPHRFWLVTGSRSEKVGIQPEDSIHLMPVVWDAETGVVPPDINPQLSVTRDGDTVAQLAPWPMLSQPMGFHFGDNVALDGDRTYRVEVSIGSPSTRRTGSLTDNRGQEAFSFDFAFRQSALQDITYRDVPSEKEGTRGAVDPMGMEGMPSTQVPTPDALPGTVRGTATSGDARFVVTTLPDATPFGGGSDETYLAVSPRTPYSRYILPLMSLSATLRRGDEILYGGPLRTTIDPDLRYHYGAAVPGVESGDDLAITVDAPPQTARHEGYETAFLDMAGMDLTL
ncbi:MAG: iron transporter [Haloferacaceae archaeon]